MDVEGAGFGPKSKEAQSVEEDCCGLDYYCFFGYEVKPKSKENGLNKLLNTFLTRTWHFIPSFASWIRR